MKAIAVVVTLVIMALLGVAGLSAIASQRPAGPAVGNNAVEIDMTEMRFSPNRIDARVGQPVVLTLVNRGSQRHDLGFPSIEMPGLKGVETLTMPGQTTHVTVTFDKAGEYVFLCTIPGHAASGMTGAAFVLP
jgi:uncharacterized cupredoxin-like copper-binding protein